MAPKSYFFFISIHNDDKELHFFHELLLRYLNVFVYTPDICNFSLYRMECWPCTRLSLFKQNIHHGCVFLPFSFFVFFRFYWIFFCVYKQIFSVFFRITDQVSERDWRKKYELYVHPHYFIIKKKFFFAVKMWTHHKCGCISVGG